MLNANDLRHMTHKYHMAEIQKKMILSMQQGSNELGYSVLAEYADDIVDELKEQDYKVMVYNSPRNNGHKIIDISW